MKTVVRPSWLLSLVLLAACSGGGRGTGIIIEPPIGIVSAAVRYAIVGEAYVYAPTLAPGETGTWALAQGPAGLEIDAVTGRLTWPLPIAGDYTVEFLASTSRGTFSQQFALVVIAPIVVASESVIAAQGGIVRAEGAAAATLAGLFVAATPGTFASDATVVIERLPGLPAPDGAQLYGDSFRVRFDAALTAPLAVTLPTLSLPGGTQLQPLLASAAATVSGTERWFVPIPRTAGDRSIHRSGTVHQPVVLTASSPLLTTTPHTVFWLDEPIFRIWGTPANGSQNDLAATLIDIAQRQNLFPYLAPHADTIEIVVRSSNNTGAAMPDYVQVDADLPFLGTARQTMASVLAQEIFHVLQLRWLGSRELSQLPPRTRGAAVWGLMELMAAVYRYEHESEPNVGPFVDAYGRLAPAFYAAMRRGPFDERSWQFFAMLWRYAALVEGFDPQLFWATLNPFLFPLASGGPTTVLGAVAAGGLDVAAVAPDFYRELFLQDEHSAWRIGRSIHGGTVGAYEQPVFASAMDLGAERMVFAELISPAATVYEARLFPGLTLRGGPGATLVDGVWGNRLGPFGCDAAIFTWAVEPPFHEIEIEIDAPSHVIVTVHRGDADNTRFVEYVSLERLTTRAGEPLLSITTADAGTNPRALALTVLNESATAAATFAIRVRPRTVDDRMVEIPFLPTYSNAVPQGVNADGSVVIGTSAYHFGGHRAWRWTEAGGTVDLGFLPGGSWAIAGAVDAAGTQVFGVGGTVSGSALFRWTPSQGMTEVLPAATSGVSVVDASADGSRVIGRSSTIDSFFWPGGGPTLTVPFLATAISGDDGTVVGATAGQFGRQPRRWRAGVTTPLPVLDPAAGHVVNDVTADGSIIVGGEWAPGTFEPRAALKWVDGQAPVRFGARSIDSRMAVGVSADGTVILGDDGVWQGGVFRHLHPTQPTRLLSADGSTAVGWLGAGRAVRWTLEPR